jgi:hypothetical protein
MSTKKSIFRIFFFLFALTFTLAQSGSVFAYDLSAGTAGDNYGYNVARDGNLLVVGAPGTDVSSNANQGTAYVYDCSALPCIQKAQLFASDGNADDSFGGAVAIKNGLVMVGAAGKEGVGGPVTDPQHGATYVFNCSGSPLSCPQQSILHSPTPTDNGRFGVSIAISGTTAVVGAYMENPETGKAYVFDCSAPTSCGLKSTLTPVVGGWYFGVSVAIDGTLIAVGSYAEDITYQDSGSAYVFNCNAAFTDCSSYVKLTPAAPVQYGNFGRMVAVSGSTVVIGARGDTIGGNIKQGSAYVYDCSSFPCSTPNKIFASDGAASDSFGVGMVMKNSTLVIGAVDRNSSQGAAYVFQCSGTACTQSKKFVAFDGVAGDTFGFTLAFEGDEFTVGAMYDDVGSNVDQGSIYFFTPHTISGNAGVPGATLSYTDGTAKTTTADASGNYSFTVYSWSVTVTPSKTGYTFSPASRSYTNVAANQTAQDYTAYGWNANVKVNDDVGTTTQNTPNLIADNSGNLYLAWGDGRNGNQDIYFAKSANRGVTWSANAKVNDDAGSSYQALPNLTRDSSGNLYLVWEDARNGNYSIYFAKSTNGGSTWSANVKVSDTLSDARSPSLVVDSVGNLYVAWTDNRGGYWDDYVAKSTNGGAIWSASVKVNNDTSTTTNGRPPALAVDNSDNLYLVWTTANGGYDLYSAKSTNGGVTWSAGVKINDVAGQVWLSSPPGLTADASGTLYTIWNDTRDFAGKSHIYFSKSTDGGSTWSANVDASQNPNGTSTVYLMGLVVDSSGALSAVWGDSREGDEWNVYFAQSTNGGTNWSAAIRVNDSTTLDQYQATMAVDGNDNLYTAWADSRSGNHDIYFSRWNNQYPAHVIAGNAGIDGATLSYTDGTAKTTTANTNGDYSFSVSYNWTGTVTPSKTGYTFTPASKPYTNVLADQTAQNYTATAITPATITISGNAGVAGAMLSYTDGSAKTATADGSGNYSFTVSYNWSGTVTPSKTGYVFSTAKSYTNVLADQTAQDFTATPITYAISGNAGVAGVTLSYMDGTSKTATADGSGNYSFTVSYNWSGVVVPSKTGYVFSTAKSYTNVLADQTAQDYTATAITYTISGNAGVGGATLSYTDGAAKAATADGSGDYLFTVSYNWSGTVTPSKAGYTFSTARSYTNVLANQTAQNYTATPVTYAISGNAGVAGATLSYTDGAAKTATADVSGSYSFIVSYNWSGTVTPSMTGYAFTPASKIYANIVANQTAQNYTATLVTYTISGNAGIAGATLSYTDGAVKTATADGSGNYSFTVSYNWSGTVTPSMTGYTFTPESRSYTNVLADQTAQDYTATLIMYTISGNAGIAGTTLSYTDGLAKTVTVDSHGDYSFTVSYNWSGTVTPSKPGHGFLPATRVYANVIADQLAQDYAIYAPAGAVADTTPTYTWNKVNGAAKYEYQVMKGTSTVYTKAVGSAACGSITCSNTPSTDLGLGTFKWRVRANVGGKWQAYSAFKSFAIKPKAGRWECVTGCKNRTDLVFYITPNQAGVDKFSVVFYSNSCGNKGFATTPHPLVPIKNNSFSFSGSFYVRDVTFVSPTRIKGSTGVTNYSFPGCPNQTLGPYTWEAAWKNETQPLATELDPASIFIIEPAP